MDHPLLVVVGPTGSGKSALALHLAETFRGEIVNSDSLQVYRGFDIGTAKTPLDERRGIPHHLFDVLDPRMGYSSGEYARAARAALGEIATRGALPILVGGTGFYLQAVLQGLPQLPGRDEALRETLRQRETARPGVLHRFLRRSDAASAARIHLNDTQKLIRAVEIVAMTGRPRATSQAPEPLEGFRVLTIGLDPPRDELAAKIAARAREMFRCGLIEEVRALLASGCTGEEKPFESIGYKQALLTLRGSLSVEDAIESTSIETRQYAKRQRTWFRRDTSIQWTHSFGNADATRRTNERLVSNFLGALRT